MIKEKKKETRGKKGQSPREVETGLSKTVSPSQLQGDRECPLLTRWVRVTNNDHGGGTGKETQEKETQMGRLRNKTRMNEEHWVSAEGRGEKTGLRYYCGVFFLAGGH